MNEGLDIEAKITESASRPAARYRILVADDERPIRDIITKVLSAQGHAVDCCGDGEAALRMAQTERYDLLVLDFNMPLKNGAEVIQELRARSNKIPILFMSCQALEKLERLSEGAQFVRYLPKPFRLEDLRAAVEAATAA